MSLPSEIDALLELLSSGALDEASSVRLDALLREDASARRKYIAWMSTEAELYALHAQGARVGPDSLVAPGSMVEPMASRRETHKPAPTWLAIATSLALVATGSSWLTREAFLAGRGATSHSVAHAHAPDPDHQLGAANEDAAEQPPAVDSVARITGTRNCRWGADSIGYGDALVAGQRLRLVAGLAEVTFKNGARVVLEGPSSLDLDELGHATLVEGQLAAEVPSDASTFCLRTSRIGVNAAEQLGVDAEFGLYADGRGGGEVHAFTGPLEASLLNRTGGQLRTLRLRPQEAARLMPASTTLARFHADGDQFVRSIFTAAGPHDGLYAYEGFDYASGPLSWQNGGFGWAGPWADIESDRSGEMATNVVRDGSLVVPLAVDEQGVPVSDAAGGRAVQTAQRNRIRRALGTSLGGVFDSAGLVENRDGHRLIGRDGETVYIGFLQLVDRKADGFYGFELHRGDGNSNRVLCIGNGAEGAGYGVTSNFNAYGAANYGRLGDEDTDANFYVVRIDFHAADRDVATVYRNPRSLVDESVCVADVRLRGNFAFDRISLGNFDGKKTHEVDELRIGTAYRAVTGQRDHAPEAFRDRVAAQPPAQPRVAQHTRNNNSLNRSLGFLTNVAI